MMANPRQTPYLGNTMTQTPDFLNVSRPDVPDLSIPRGVTPFFLPKLPVRGRLVRLGPLADALLTRHDHPAPVRALLGQALALVAGLATALKFSGSFSLQAKGDGAVPLLLADCTDTGALRGYARIADELPLPETHHARALMGDGYLALTVDQGPDSERHQGIVTLEGETLADMALHYFSTSEQLACAIHLACAETSHGWRAAALIVERIAGAGGVDPALSEAEQDEAWRTAKILAATITDAELLDDTLPAERVLYRLFHGEGVAADRPRPLAYGCRCSRARLADLLNGFAPDDLDHMAIDGTITMTCEFCNVDFRFPRAPIGQSDIPEPDVKATNPRPNA
jgi:molecular chaperone Hsp33